MTTDPQNTQTDHITDTETDGAPEGKPFADFGVGEEITQALAAAGITHAFPIQALTLPVALDGHDIIGQAKTGTGKTLGFGIPALQRVIGPGEPGFDELELPGKPQALVIVPTRELAVQVANDLATAGKRRSVRVLTVYGGRAYEPQIDALRKGIELVVGTPGRLIDLAQQGHLSLACARIVVLDEADEMLDLGFLPDVEKLLSMTPAGRQTMLFSATMPSAVVALARRFMTQPTHIRAHDPDDTGATVKAIKQVVYRAHSLDKVEMLARILQARERGLTIIFARTKRTVAKVAEELTDRGFAVGAIHGDLGQGAREQALRAFRKGKVDVLVATDVAARGIDVEEVTHVINYQCPEDEKTYLHRIGRTGRAGATGTAVTFVDWDEEMRWALIDKALELGMPRAVETYSSSPHLFEDLDIPAGTRGMLPRGSRTRAGLEAEDVEDLGETGQRHGGRGEGRGKGRGRGARSSGRESEARSDDATEESRPRRARNRRRTRGGVTADGSTVSSPEATVSDSDAGTTQSGSASSGSASSGSVTGEGSEGAAPRKRSRRRTRGSRTSERGAAEAPVAATAAAE